jgi:hypothetical protein
MSQEGPRTEPEVTELAVAAIEGIDQAKVAAEAAKKAEAEKAAALEAAKKAELEAIANRFRFSINADTLARRLQAHEQNRLKSRSKLPPDPIQIRLPAYLEQKFGAKLNMRPVIITNIGTIGGELKIVEGNSTRQIADNTTLFLDTHALTELQLGENDVRSDKKISYLGNDPTLSLDERLELERKRLAEQASTLFEDAPEEVTQVRKIGDRTKTAAADALSAIETPSKIA